MNGIKPNDRHQTAPDKLAKPGMITGMIIVRTPCMARRPKKPPAPLRPSRITVPEHAHPFAKLLFNEMRRQRVSYFELEMRSGVLTSTFKAYRTDNAPGLASIEAALGAVGWTLVPVPKLDTLPHHVREALDELGEHFRSDEETFGAALVAAAEFPAHARRQIESRRMAAAA